MRSHDPQGCWSMSYTFYGRKNNNDSFSLWCAKYRCYSPYLNGVVVIFSVIYESTGGPWVTALPLHNQPTYRRRILISLFLCVNTQNLPHILHPIHQVDSASSDYIVHLPTSCLHAYSLVSTFEPIFRNDFAYVLLTSTSRWKAQERFISRLRRPCALISFSFFLFSLSSSSFDLLLSSKNKLSINCPSPPNILYAVPVSQSSCWQPDYFDHHTLASCRTKDFFFLSTHRLFQRKGHI